MTSLTYQNQTASKSLFQAGFVGRPGEGGGAEGVQLHRKSRWRSLQAEVDEKRGLAQLLFRIRRKGCQPGVLYPAADREMVEVLEFTSFEAEEFVHGVIKIATDTCAT